MTIQRYYCQACGLVFHCDLEILEDSIELRGCPCCLSAGHLVAEGEPASLCPSCRDGLPPEPADDEPEKYTVC